ncbi:hypothetical protein LTR84_012236 [Exophiala bonariae]|uniref:MARVEL domain-containing protein n=1 Tax=Exophiala bonariae TaxID=1690606 RepID=A0AAV9NGM8_9EURO|nr:hypothetical protein LTR84_012236 [Exophiala bonariae]
MSSSYEPFRSRSQGTEDIKEDSEKLIEPEPQRETTSLTLPRLQSPSSGRAKHAKHARVGLRVVALAIAVTVLGIQVHSAQIWLSTRDRVVFNRTTKLDTHSWAVIDMWPTWTMIAAAGLATSIQLSALTSHLCICLVDRHGSRQHAVSVYVTSAILIAFWIAAMFYFKLANYQGKKKSMWDIWTWSCHQQDVAGDIPWKALCIQQQYTWFASIVVAVTEVVVLILFIYNRRDMRGARSTQGKFSLIPNLGA